MDRWGRCVRCFAFALLALTLFAAPLLAAPAHVPGEVIVKFRPGVSAAAIAAIRADLGGTLKSEYRLAADGKELIVKLTLDQPEGMPGLSLERVYALYRSASWTGAEDASSERAPVTRTAVSPMRAAR